MPPTLKARILNNTFSAQPSFEMHQQRILQHMSSAAVPTSRCRRCCCTAAAASKPGPLVGLQRMPDAQPTATVVERRAADVAVIGGGVTAVLSAYTLAKAGKKVLLLSDFGLSAVPPQGSPLQPLKFTDTDPLLVHLAAESAAYWRGLELLAGSPLMSPQATCDLVLQPDRDHKGAEGFAKLQDACTAAGVTAVPLSCSEAMAKFRQLQLPHSSSCLMQPEGAVLQAGDVAAAAKQLAENVGVIMRGGLVLRGWRDRGSCFQLRASSRLAPELLSMFEAEVLLLAPNHWTMSCLGLFGLQVEGLQAREVLHCQLAGGVWQQQQQLPLWQFWGAATPPDQPQQPAGMTGLPAVPGHHGGWVLQQAPAFGRAVHDPLTWQPASAQWLARRGGEEQQQPMGDNTGLSWADMQVQQLHQTCSQLVRDVAPLESIKLRSTVRSCTADGRPVLGQHPGFDAGRVVAVASASGTEPYGAGSCSSTFQLSPMLAKLAGDMIRAGGSSSSEGAILAGIALQREGMSAAAVQGFDGWERLEVLQQAQAPSDLDVEKAADEAADKRQDLQWQEGSGV